MTNTKSYDSGAFRLLQIFAEGGSSEGTGTGNGEMGVTATDAMSQVSVEPSSQAQDNVQAPDLDKQFADMINGEYKEQYKKSVNDVVKKRLKNSKETTEKFEKLQSVLPKLGKMFNVDSNDIDAFIGAVNNDDRLYEEEALEAGVDVEFYKRMKQAEEQNKALAEEKQMREDVSRWYNDFETNVKNSFPNLSFDDLISNPQFTRLMHNGIDALSAVTAIYARDLIPAAMESAANEATKRVVDDIAANGNRPIEGAAKSSATVVSSIDVSSMSDAQVEYYKNLALRGEQGINFKTKY